jgi:hypothetical protein
MSHFPVGMFGIFLSISVMAVLYAMSYRPGSGLAAGAIFGVLFGLFYLGSFVLHNYANLNIGLRLTVLSAVAFMFEWVAVGVVLGLVYQPKEFRSPDRAGCPLIKQIRISFREAVPRSSQFYRDERAFT